MTEKLEKCACGNYASIHQTVEGRWCRVCVSCGAQTPHLETPEEADAAWTRMQSAETFTREDLLSFALFYQTDYKRLDTYGSLNAWLKKRRL